MSMGLARAVGGGFQQAFSFVTMSRILSTCPGSVSPAEPDRQSSSAAADQTRVWRPRDTDPHLMSDATCAFTIFSGSVPSPPREPGGAFLSLSTTSIPDTTSPITVYWPFRLGPSANMKKNCEFAVSTLSPRRAIPTMPRLNGTLENSAFRLGYFEPPVPLKFWPSPVCAMKPSITRWNGTLL